MMFHQVILGFAVLGVVINLIAFVIITKKKDKTMFHDLLKILTAYDVGVVICCALQFALPNLWPAYYLNIYPHIMPYLVPVMHVTVLTSVYSTILISFERYIRICFYCQLRETRVLSDDNVKYYKLFVILFPMLFYIPKCFEVRTGYVVQEKKMRIDCQKYLSLSQLLENPLLKSFIGQSFTDADLVKIEFLAKACNKIISEEMQFEDKNHTYRNQTSKRRSQNQNETARSFHLVTTQPPILKSQEPKSLYRNVTTSIKKSVQAEPTELRRNPYYYQIYYVYLNTIFASLLPLFLLLFFNMQTARELFKMSKLETRTLVSRASNVNLNRRATMVDFNPRGTAEDPRVEALRLAADAHGLANGTNEALLAAHQNCAYETTSALPVITLTEEEAAKNERIQVHSEDVGKISSGATDAHNEVFEEIQKCPVGHPKQRSGQCQPQQPQKRQISSRRSTITFLIKSHNDLVPESISNHQQVDPLDDQDPNQSDLDITKKYLLVNEEDPDPDELDAGRLDSNGSLQRTSSLDASRWVGLRTNRRRASSVFSANSTALRMSLSRALSARATSRRPTTTTLLSLNPSRSETSSRRQSSTETKKELRLARISLCIVWLFLFCHFWKLFPTVYATFFDDNADASEDKALGLVTDYPEWLLVIEDISHTLITLNSSLNFLLYLVL